MNRILDVLYVLLVLTVLGTGVVTWRCGLGQEGTREEEDFCRTLCHGVGAEMDRVLVAYCTGYTCSCQNGVLVNVLVPPKGK